MAFGLHNVASIGGERYVYYRRLETDGYTQLYGKALNTLNLRIQDGTDYQALADYFTTMRDSEYRKEVELLKAKFGATIQTTYDEQDKRDIVGKELIEAFNRVFNLQSTAQYSLGLITQTKMKGIISYFPSYFKKAWQTRSDELAELIENTERTYGEGWREYLPSVIHNYVAQLVRECFIRMYRDAANQKGIEGTIYDIQKPYEQLAQAIEDATDEGNKFIEEMLKTFGLNDYINSLSKQFENIKDPTVRFKSLPTQAIKVRGSTGGTAKEYEAILIGQIVEKVFRNTSNAKVSFKHTGGANVKPDWVIAIDLDEGTLEDYAQKAEFGEGRREHVRAAAELKSKLQTASEGYLIYVNAKDYSLHSKWFDENGGMSGESNVSLRTWDEILHTMHLASANIVFTIMQLIPGAIGDQEEGHVTTMMTRAIAGALFDDFDVKGSVPKTGAKALHLLYINGLYIPMSFFYDRLAQAFEYMYDNIRELVQVSFALPDSIMFPYVYPEEGGDATNNEELWREEHPDESPWAAQANAALDNIKISYHFFHGFKRVIEQLGLDFT